VLKSFLHFIEETGLPLEKHQTVLLAVSGGADSVCMARLLYQAGFKAAIAHINYGLRGKESDEDADFVALLAAELGFGFHLLEATVPETEKRELGLQAAARNLRYRWFSQLCKEEGYRYVATAHQSDDVLETYLLYERQGRQTAALNALPLIRPLDNSDPDSPLLLRPLRFAIRKEIRNWLQQEGFTWREDSSNAKPAYARNRLRQELELSADAHAELTAIIHAKQASHQLQTRSWQAITHTVTYAEYGETVILYAAVYALPDGEAWLHWFLRSFGFTTAQGTQIWVNGRNAGKTYISLSGWKIETARGRWYLLKDQYEPWEDIVLRAGEQALALPFTQVGLEKGVSNFHPRSNVHMAFQFEETDPVLVLRRFRTGETMLIANSGHRKISDILSEAGIPRHRRAVWPVVEYKGEVIAIPMVKRSGLFPVIDTGEASVCWICAAEDKT
jgi:tRNA(Ile)-lysidine synthase